MYIYRIFYFSICTGYFYRVSKKKEREKKVHLRLMGQLFISFFGSRSLAALAVVGRNDGDGVARGGSGATLQELVSSRACGIESPEQPKSDTLELGDVVKSGKEKQNEQPNVFNFLFKGLVLLPVARRQKVFGF